MTEFIVKTRCDICLDEGMVCEDHPNRQWDWGEGCCGAAGMFCECFKKKLADQAADVKPEPEIPIYKEMLDY